MAAHASVALNGDSPLYRQIIEHLRGEVSRLEPGSRIASETQLAKSFAVSRFTVARAIEALAEEGLLYRRQGLGTFVAAPPLKRAPGYLMSFTEAVRKSGHTPTHRLLGFGPTPWRPDLPYPADEPLVAFDRLRMVDGLPAAIHRSVLTEALLGSIGLTAEVAATPRFSLYARLALSGLSVESAVERLRARCATAEEARLLDLGAGDAVMAVGRISFATDGTLLDVVDAVYDARRYSYEARILRGRQSQSAAPSNGNDRETGHEHHPDSDRIFGARLGPWTDDRRGTSG